MNETVGLTAVVGVLLVGSAIPATSKASVIVGGLLLLTILTTTWQNGSLRDFGAAIGGL